MRGETDKHDTLAPAGCKSCGWLLGKKCLIYSKLSKWSDTCASCWCCRCQDFS